MGSSMRLAGSVAIVMGAGSCAPGWGNGRATAVLFAREGARLVAVDKDPDALAETVRLVEAEGHGCTAETLDVRDEDAVADLVRRCIAVHGGVDVLHFNVGLGMPGAVTEISTADFRAQLDLNLVSLFIACRAVLPGMVERGRGVITAVGSTSGMRHPGHDHVGYSVSKAGMIQLMRQIAVCYGPHGIRANTLVPGLMATPLIEHRVAKHGKRGSLADLQETARRRVPLGHRGDGWDVAYAALYLASQEAKYVNGTELVVDGGFLAKSP
ncbi:MAG: SDR family oxidoreductase [Alphaproteobacteria bacterium]|nr:SDR family oxidoreductase [Alphaproteobacteria bacterium]